MSIHVWKTGLYDEKLDYVSAFGKDVAALLAPQPGERILDLGCGTGDLAHDISTSGASVLGMDISAQMIEAAKRKYPKLDFMTGDAEHFALDEPVDAVFSNAALHWMTRPERVIGCIWNVLKPGGRFVAEFGGKGNVEKIVNGIIRVLERDCGVNAAARNPWYFPSIGQYSTLLEQQGFRVTYAVHFDRPTPMKDGENGLNLWLTGYADDFFAGLSPRDKQEAIRTIEDELRGELYKDGTWYIDYSRLRIMAVKPR